MQFPIGTRIRFLDQCHPHYWPIRATIVEAKGDYPTCRYTVELDANDKFLPPSVNVWHEWLGSYFAVEAATPFNRFEVNHRVFDNVDDAIADAELQARLLNRPVAIRGFHNA